MKHNFKTGDEVEYAYGLKYTFLAIDPFDETEAYNSNRPNATKLKI